MVLEEILQGFKNSFEDFANKDIYIQRGYFL